MQTPASAIFKHKPVSKLALYYHYHPLHIHYQQTAWQTQEQLWDVVHLCTLQWKLLENIVEPPGREPGKNFDSSLTRLMKILTPLCQPVYMESRDVTGWVQETRENRQLFGSDVIPFVAMPHHQLACPIAFRRACSTLAMSSGWKVSINASLCSASIMNSRAANDGPGPKREGVLWATTRKVGLYRFGLVVLSLFNSKSDFRRTNWT